MTETGRRPLPDRDTFRYALVSGVGGAIAVAAAGVRLWPAILVGIVVTLSVALIQRFGLGTKVLKIIRENNG